MGPVVAIRLGVVVAGVLESSVSVGGSGGEERICRDVAASFVDPSCDVVLFLEVSFVGLGREVVLGHSQWSNKFTSY